MEKKLVEKYSENHKVRALVNLIPHIGGALDVLLSEKGAKWREERLMKLLSELDSRIGNLENNSLIEKILNETAESEEFYDLLIQSLNSVIRTRHEEKIYCYANILLNYIQNPSTKKYSSELMIATLDSITIDEIEYLSEINRESGSIELHVVFGVKIFAEKYQEIITNTHKVADNSNQLPHDCKFHFDNEFLWKLLSDKNLITVEKTNQHGSFPYSYGSSMYKHSSEIQYSEKVIYKLTEFGEEFINWIIKN